jgi:hypothetical protein
MQLSSWLSYTLLARAVFPIPTIPHIDITRHCSPCWEISLMRWDLSVSRPMMSGAFP